MEERYEKEKINEEELIDRQIEKIMSTTAENSSEDGKKDRRKIFGKLKGWSRKRKVLTGAVLLAVLFFLSRLAAGGSSGGFSASVMALEKKPVQEKLSVSGPVEGTDSVDVVSNIHAEIISMNVKEGDQVIKGQILATLDQTDLEREVEIARNAYELAAANQAEQNKTQALGYEKAVQDCQAAQADYDRKSMLYANGDISQVEMETAANALADARRHMEEYTVVNGVGTADPSYELQVKAAAFTLEKAQKELENTEIKSAIDGTVVRVNSKVGQFADKVENDKPILSIENLEELEMEIKISEYSIGKVKLGQKVQISADILNGKTVEGEVIKISPTGEEKGGGSTERVIPAAIRITDADSGLMAGITARARIRIDQAEGAFIVPMGAVLETDEGTWIFAVEGNRLKRIPVETGVESDVQIQVIPVEEGSLQEGMQIAASASADMADGMQVLALPQA